MRKASMMGALILVMAALTGCATAVKAPIVGGIYTNTTGPELVTANTSGSKTGTATCEAILGIANGDCSIGAAMKNGGISKVHHVDSKVKDVLGIYVEYTTIVRGE